MKERILSVSLSFLRIISSVLYKLLGANVSVRLAYSPLGKLIFRLFIGTDNKPRIYQATGGIRVKLTPSEAIGLGILHLGVINKCETDVMKRILKRGDNVIDVGTFVDGWHTLLAAKLVGRGGHVYSFEPHPLYFKRLEENIELNRLRNVTAERLGVSDREETVLFYEGSSGSSLIKSLAEDFVGPQNATAYKIRTTTLNLYIARKRMREGIRLIKIDVEGAEMRVLKESDELLKLTNAPDLIVEVWEKYLRRAGSSEKELVTYLRKFGYQPYRFTTRGLKRYHGRISEDSSMFNIYFTKNRVSLD